MTPASPYAQYLTVGCHTIGPPTVSLFVRRSQLVVITIISILIALSTTGWNTMVYSRNRAATINSLRCIAVGVQAYAAENDGSLPGPTVSCIKPSYQRGDPAAMGSLLWCYIGAPEPTNKYQEAKALTNPGYLKYRQDPLSPVYLLNYWIGTGYRPWGNGGVSPGLPAMKLAALNNIMNPSDTWAIQDLDQLSVSSANGWWSQLPKKPVNGNLRMTMYYDWHIEGVPVK